METYGAIVGSLALVVAAASLGWQVFTWLRAGQETTEVDIGPVGVAGVGQVVQVEVRNKSPQPIYVVGAALSVSGGGPGFSVIHLVPGPAGSSIPGVIAPMNSGKTWVPLAQLPPWPSLRGRSKLRSGWRIAETRSARDEWLGSRPMVGSGNTPHSARPETNQFDGDVRGLETHA